MRFLRVSVPVLRRFLPCVAMALVVIRPAWSEDPYLVEDINPGTASGVDQEWFGAGEGELFFRARTVSNGNELWHSDGTLAGTDIVADLYPGSSSSNPYAPVLLSDWILFGAAAPAGSGLWRTDQNSFVTTVVRDELAIYAPGNPQILVKSGALVYFVAQVVGDQTAGRELWISDGTPGGTEMVKDIWPGGTSSYPEGLVDYGGRVVFAADDGIHGQELWISDGTESGTEMVLDIWPDAATSLPSELAVVGDEVFFVAGQSGIGHELWKSDGTEVGTTLVKDIWPGDQGGGAAEITDVGGIAFFRSIGDGSTGGELWRSDGTEDGTYLVKDIRPGVTPSYVGNLTGVGGRLFFIADDGVHGSELWRSDGTEAGTVLVKDIFPGTSDSDPDNFFEFRGHLYFTADDGVNGHELWRSNGAEAGTLMVADINPDGISFPAEFTFIDGLIFISAYHVDFGRELWAFTSPILFFGGFETGDTSEWSATIP